MQRLKKENIYRFGSKISQIKIKEQTTKYKKLMQHIVERLLNLQIYKEFLLSKKNEHYRRQRDMNRQVTRTI